MDDLTVVVFCNKKDFYLTRISIASIRYFYKEIKILLVKDELNGDFSTKEIEKRFNVEIYDCGKRKFGWAASKTFFLLQTKKDYKYFLLDSDIVFIEPFLERIYPLLTSEAFVVSAEYDKDINTAHINRTYFNVSDVLRHDPDYQYPGFFFNTGQIFIIGGKVNQYHLSKYFDTNNFPYWKRLDLFPMVDQSVYNYIFSKLHRQGILQLIPQQFMIWSQGAEAKKILIRDVIAKTAQGGLIHWAGARRTPFINRMTRFDILDFFQTEYYKEISFGRLKIETRKIMFELYSYSLRIKNKIRKIINERSRKNVI